jgi:hypothetical protein
MVCIPCDQTEERRASVAVNSGDRGTQNAREGWAVVHVQAGIYKVGKFVPNAGGNENKAGRY